MPVEMWRVEIGRIRCHIETGKLYRRIMELQGVVHVSTYFYHERVIGWDVDIPATQKDRVENILGVKTGV